MFGLFISPQTLFNKCFYSGVWRRNHRIFVVRAAFNANLTMSGELFFFLAAYSFLVLLLLRLLLWLLGWLAGWLRVVRSTAWRRCMCAVRIKCTCCLLVSMGVYVFCVLARFVWARIWFCVLCTRVCIVPFIFVFDWFYIINLLKKRQNYFTIILDSCEYELEHCWLLLYCNIAEYVSCTNVNSIIIFFLFDNGQEQI